MAKKLTEIAIQKIKPDRSRRLEIPDAGKPGLYLVVQPSGRKSWAVRYRRLTDGRPRKLTLDGFPSLGAARKRAQEALDKVADGLDPAAEKKATREARGSDLLRDVAAQFVARHVKPNTRASYARETERLLNKEILPQYGETGECKRLASVTCSTCSMPSLIEEGPHGQPRVRGHPQVVQLERTAGRLMMPRRLLASEPPSQSNPVTEFLVMMRFDGFGERATSSPIHSEIWSSCCCLLDSVVARSLA